MFSSNFWQKTVYKLVIYGCSLFILLTVVAMFTYPGGNAQEELTSGYDFFGNFFSDLGRTAVSGGRANTVSAVLFFIALTMAGGGLILFFIAFRRFFVRNRTEVILSNIASFFGIVAGLCFIGVAFTPYNLYLDAHKQFVMWAFRMFFVAVGIYAFVILRQNVYPRHYGWVFVAFAIFLAAYIVLLTYGPDIKTPEGMVIQAVGQKLIVYTSIICVIVQSWLALKVRERG